MMRLTDIFGRTISPQYASELFRELEALLLPPTAASHHRCDVATMWPDDRFQEMEKVSKMAEMGRFCRGVSELLGSLGPEQASF
ncbi:hypothetical protein [Devosia sp. 1566]|uniref:hypothetical protein n=1 Tax=Devosia sp. 1566 TaxID=2499144 RepID=UPI000FD9E0D7|nr:hypothetical protein [Devosia sp. 1566]